MILPYIIKVSLILVACLAFYKLLLGHETFYKANRFLLIACLVIAFALPFLQVPQQLSLRKVYGQSSVVNGELAKNNQQPTGNTQELARNNQSSTVSNEPTTNNEPQTSNLKPQTT